MRYRLVYLFSVISLTAVCQITEGGNGHSLVLDKSGCVWTAGRNNYGQLGDGSLNTSAISAKVSGLPKIVAVARGYEHCAALDEKGSLWLWGRNNYGQLGQAIITDKVRPVKL